MNRRKPETERRRWLRLPFVIPVFVHSSDDNGQEFLEFASALNVSAGGALLAVHRCPPLCSTLLLEIPSPPLAFLLPATAHSRNIRAETVRVTHGEGYHLVGLKFSKPLPIDTIQPTAAKRKSGSLR